MSTFTVMCPCGKEAASPALPIKCGHCKRVLEAHWPGDDDPEPEPKPLPGLDDHVDAEPREVSAIAGAGGKP